MYCNTLFHHFNNRQDREKEDKYDVDTVAFPHLIDDMAGGPQVTPSSTLSHKNSADRCVDRSNTAPAAPAISMSPAPSAGTDLADCSPSQDAPPTAPPSPPDDRLAAKAAGAAPVAHDRPARARWQRVRALSAGPRAPRPFKAGGTLTPAEAAFLAAFLTAIAAVRLDRDPPLRPAQPTAAKQKQFT